MEPTTALTEVAELRAELERARARVDTLEAELARHEDEAAVRSEQLERYAADLRDTFKRERTRAHELKRSYRATVRALANAVEARDAYTGKHAERVASYGLEIARAVGMPLADNPEIEFGFLLHDIGKVAVPDSILFKPEPLDGPERDVMERHAEIGWEILREITFLGEAKLVVRHHHERWDGAGYPDGLAGEQIPLAARVFSAADTFDALTTDRPYRPGMEVSRARAIIEEGSGTQFDPEVVAAFCTVPDAEFTRIAEEIR